MPTDIEIAVRVSTQADFDAAVTAGKPIVVVDAILTLASGFVKIVGCEGVTDRGQNAQVVLTASSSGVFWGNSRGVFRENSRGEFWGNSSGEFWGNSSGEFWGNSRGVFRENSSGEFKENSSGVFWGNSRGEFRENSRGEFWGNSSGEFWGNSRGVFRENSRGEFWGNSSGVARGSWIGSPPPNGNLVLENRADLFRVLASAPNEVDGLRAALVEGKINGSCYEGDCACLVGTLEKIRGCPANQIIKRDAHRPAEALFMPIAPGHTPETSPLVLVIVGWIDQWKAQNAAVAAQ